MKILMMILFVFGQGQSFDLQLKSYLNSKLSSYEKYEYEILRLPQDAKLEIDTDRSFRLAGEFAYVPVKVFDAKKSESRSVITLRIKLYKNVLVSKKKISRDEPLSVSMFNKKLMNISGLEEKAADENKLHNCRSKVLIKNNSILFESMIEPIPVINSGDKVTIHTGDKSVDVSVDGIARQDGVTNQVISVQCRSQVFKARVIDKYNLSLVE